jgi:hypothetical protein
MESFDFNYQYAGSKQIAIDAIRNGLHVVLLGGDGTGKTHLTNELVQEGYLNLGKYIRVYEGDTNYQQWEYQPSVQRFWIEAHGDLNYCLRLVKDESFVVIKMSTLKHPSCEKSNSDEP